MTIAHRNAAAEATEVVNDPSLSPLVLEPSAPANTDPVFFADDPTDRLAHAGRVVSPVGDGDLTWDELVADRPDLTSFAADRWLGAHRRLEALPAGYTETREALHQLAFFAMAPKRHAVNGKIALRYTHNGFGTPFFGEDEQVRIESGVLVHQTADAVRTTEVTTVNAACDFLGVPYVVEWFPDLHDPLKPVDPDMSLSVDTVAAEALGDWFGFSASVLEGVRRIEGAVDASRVQLWAEHFDPATELGSMEKEQRASFGASPGDGANPEPYLYVAAWYGVDKEDPFWNAESFGGAQLDYSDLLAADDQRTTALDFFRTAYEKLSS